MRIINWGLETNPLGIIPLGDTLTANDHAYAGELEAALSEGERRRVLADYHDATAERARSVFDAIAADLGSGTGASMGERLLVPRQTVNSSSTT